MAGNIGGSLDFIHRTGLQVVLFIPVHSVDYTLFLYIN